MRPAPRRREPQRGRSRATAFQVEHDEPGAVVDGPAADGTEETAVSPQRRCIATGEVRDRAVLLRFVVGPDGTIVPDIDERLPGRGLWLTPRRDIVDRALAKRVFARAARRQVSVPPDLADRLENLLARRVVESLGLARRAGLAGAGVDRGGDAGRHGRGAPPLCARGGAAGGGGETGAAGGGRA